MHAKFSSCFQKLKKKKVTTPHVLLTFYFQCHSEIHEKKEKSTTRFVIVSNEIFFFLQVRLTVLPSLNGTNTTTSHGGLLEVEKTFKTVDQSHREYQLQKILNATIASGKRPLVVDKRPSRNGLGGVASPSNSAVLAAVGAGMVPATMAMMIPMMLGRKKREVLVPRTLLDELELRRRM